MKVTKIIPMAVSVAALLVVTGCSNSINNPGGLTSIFGSIFDGAINGATVCVDANFNKQCDTGEPTATTDVFGDFTMDNPLALNGPLIMSGGTDMGTGLAFTGTMTAPAGSTAVSPLTSAIQSLVEDGQSAAEAETTIKKSLNIVTDKPLTSFNAVKEAKNGSADAQKILAGQSQLQTIIEAVTSTVTGADTTLATTNKNTMAKAMKKVAAALKKESDLVTDGSDVVISDKLVSKAIKDTANEVYAGNESVKVAVKVIADSSASKANTAANLTKAAIKAAVSPKDSVLASDTGILVANSSLKTAVNKASSDAAVKTKGMAAADLTALANAQKEQEDADDAIAAEIAADKAAKAAETAAVALAAQANATQAQIVAAEEAKSAAAAAAAKKAAAEKLAAQKAAVAAVLEKTAALEAQAEQDAKALAAANAEAAAQAAEDLAAARKIAADKAAIAAAAAADAAAAKLDAAAAAALEQAAIDAAILAEKTAADKAAADAAAAKLAAEQVAADAALAAKLVAEQAAADALALEEEANIAKCTATGGTYTNGECILPSVTAATN